MGKSAIQLIIEERREQKTKHGYTIENDLKYVNNELLKAALFCINTDMFEYPYTWENTSRSKIFYKDTKSKLIIGAAFILAEIDRLCFENKSKDDSIYRCIHSNLNIKVRIDGNTECKEEQPIDLIKAALFCINNKIFECPSIYKYMYETINFLNRIDQLVIAVYFIQCYIETYCNIEKDN